MSERYNAPVRGTSAAFMNRLYRSNAEDAERIRAVVLFDYVNDDFSIDNGAESDEDWKREKVLSRVRKFPA